MICLFRSALSGGIVAWVGLMGAGGWAFGESGEAKGASTSPATVVVKAHQGAWLEEVDGKAWPAPKFDLIDPGNEATVSGGKHQFAVRTERDTTKSTTGSGAGVGNGASLGNGLRAGVTVSGSYEEAQEGKVCLFELDLKPGHVYEIMSAGKHTGRLEIYDKTDRQLQFYDWGSKKLIADKSPEKKIKDYESPKLSAHEAAVVKCGRDVNVTTVDGAHVPGSSNQLMGLSGNEILLTPGTHRIVVCRTGGGITIMPGGGSASSRNDSMIEQEFLAGHQYEVRAAGWLSTAVKLEDKTVELTPVNSPTTLQADASGLPPLQAIRDKDDERPAQVTKINRARVRKTRRDGQLCIEVAADVQLDAVENVKFTLKATLLGADGKALQAGAGPVAGMRMISTGDDSDEDTYHVYVPCGAVGDAWRGGKVRVELIDPMGGVRSVLPGQPIQAVNE